ncbi:hypothetical protein TNCV_2639131 [Trichonephila clavipes]|nr:hypothetical protein TNCV_2639131 [Trichonephila clavipes]
MGLRTVYQSRYPKIDCHPLSSTQQTAIQQSWIAIKEDGPQNGPLSNGGFGRSDLRKGSVDFYSERSVTDVFELTLHKWWLRMRHWFRCICVRSENLTSEISDLGLNLWG